MIHIFIWLNQHSRYFLFPILDYHFEKNIGHFLSDHKIFWNNHILYLDHFLHRRENSTIMSPFLYVTKWPALYCLESNLRTSLKHVLVPIDTWLGQFEEQNEKVIIFRIKKEKISIFFLKNKWVNHFIEHNFLI